ncbi:unnamed protein product [Meloidogyne enterolobii]|uniref:Uncharacterized protein n=1 Tax=Meloidogyne enterolobii TaxID=390850 RepID=A0ACB1AK52_MELEN
MLKKYFCFYYSFLVCNQLIILSISGILGERIPDATEIDQYDDPLLDEVNFIYIILKKSQIRNQGLVSFNYRFFRRILSLFQIFKETNSDIQKIENVASSSINQPPTTQQQNSEYLNTKNSASSSPSQSSLPGINPNIKPPAGSLFPTEVVKHQQNNFGGFPQNPYEGGFDQYNANNNIFARTPLTDFAYQAGQTFYSGVRQASRLLGIDSGQYQQYEVPLLSQSARFFGKRK